MKRISILVLMIVMLHVLPLYAIETEKIQEKHPLDIWLSACMDTNPTTVGMIECVKQAYDKWDEQLNRAYQDLRGLLGQEDRDILRNSQRTWLKYRDAEFETINAIYSNLEGTMWLPIIELQKVNIVKERTLMLQIYRDDLLVK